MTDPPWSRPLIGSRPIHPWERPKDSPPYGKGIIVKFDDFQLLQRGDDHPKLGKNADESWHLSLAPGNMSGFEVCPRRTPGCSFACVGNSGMVRVFPNIMEARIAKTRRFFEDRAGFLRQLDTELSHLSAHLAKHKRTAYVRLNAYSDIAFETLLPQHLAEYGSLRFYDYTKIRQRAVASASRARAFTNPRTGEQIYRLCYSLSERVPNAEALSVLDAGGNVAVVFSDIKYVPSAGISGPMPSTYLGREVIDGDKHDNRFIDPPGTWIGLRLKGQRAERAHAVKTRFATPSVMFVVSARSRLSPA